MMSNSPTAAKPAFSILYPTLFCYTEPMARQITPRRRRTLPLKWEIAIALILKVALLCIIWVLWFDHPQPPDARAESVVHAILNR